MDWVRAFYGITDAFRKFGKGKYSSDGTVYHVADFDVAMQCGMYTNFTGSINFMGIHGDVENADFTLFGSGMKMKRGTWKNGVATYATFVGVSVWESGSVMAGEFGGRAVWVDGFASYARFCGNATWKNGVMATGSFMENAVWENGTWEDGVFRGNAVWKDGTWKKGWFGKGATWLGGKWEGGNFEGKTTTGRLVRLP